MKKIILLLAIFINSGILALATGMEDTIYVAKFKADKQCAISYTFDDGLEEHFTLVFPKFEKLGFKGTFWINGNTTNKDEAQRSEKPRVSWSNLKIMAEHGHEISNHGWSHKSLPKCSPDEARIEIERNDSIIEAKIGKRPVTYCYAGNAKNEEVIKLASLNRVGTRTKQFSMGSKSTTSNLEARIDTLLTKKEWGVAMIHGITYGYDAFKSDTILWNHLAKVKLLEDKIWVATFKDVAAYTAEQQQVKLKVYNKKNAIEIYPELRLDKKLFNAPLTMVISTKTNKIISVKQKGKKILVTADTDKTTFDFQAHGGKIVVKLN